MSRNDLAFRDYPGGSRWPATSPSSYYTIQNTSELDALFASDGFSDNTSVLCIWFDVRALPDPFGYFLSAGAIGNGLNVWTNAGGTISINDGSTSTGNAVVLNRGPHMYMYARDRTGTWSGRRHRIYDASGRFVEQISTSTSSSLAPFPSEIGRRADGDADRYAQDTIVSNMFVLQAGGNFGSLTEYTRFLDEIARRSAAGLNPAGVSRGFCRTLLYLPLCGTLEDISGNGRHVTHTNVGSVGLRHDTSHVAPPQQARSEEDFSVLITPSLVEPSVGEGVTLTGQRAQLSLEAMAGLSAFGASVQGAREELSLDATPGALQSGQTLTGAQSDLTITEQLGVLRSGAALDGGVARLELTPQTGEVQAGQRITGARLQLSLDARPGTLVVDDTIPAIITGARADLTLATQAGETIRGQAIDGGRLALTLGAQAGTLIVSDSIPSIITGARAELSFDARDGEFQAGVLLEGAQVLLSIDPNNGEIIHGQVIDGPPALLELLARTGNVFTGLVLVRPITRTVARDISTRYTVSERTTTYSIRSL